jgi:vacuolar-type H+-ATPase subunit F/Vma7
MQNLPTEEQKHKSLLNLYARIGELSVARKQQNELIQEIDNELSSLEKRLIVLINQKTAPSLPDKSENLIARSNKPEILPSTNP